MPVCASESGEPRAGVYRPPACGLRCPDTHMRYLRAWDGPKSAKNMQLFFFPWRVYFKYLGTWYMALLFWATKIWRQAQTELGVLKKLANSLLLWAQNRQPLSWIVLFLLCLLFWTFSNIASWGHEKSGWNVAFSHSSVGHAGYGKQHETWALAPGPWLWLSLSYFSLLALSHTM